MREQLQSEGAFRESESNRLNEEIVASAHEGIVVLDDDMRYVLWNRYMEESSGVFAKDVIGRRPWDVFPGTREEREAQLRRVLGGESLHLPDTLRRVPETGEEVWTSGTLSPRYDTAGRVTGVIALLHDVTERRKTEQALRESEERFRQITENTREVFWMRAADFSEILYVSPAPEEI